jgi:hypothetical protein
VRDLAFSTPFEEYGHALEKDFIEEEIGHYDQAEDEDIPSEI